MKNILQILLLTLLPAMLTVAQNNDYLLNMKMVIASPDTQMVTLNHTGTMNEKIEGYYLTPLHKNFFTENSGLQKGGFSFLDPDIFGGSVEQMSKKWIKNESPITDLEPMTNGLVPAKVLSFQIKPIVPDDRSDTLNLFIKYAVLDFMNNKGLDFNSRIKLFYKWFRVQYNKNITLNIFNKLFKEHKFTVLFTKEKKSEKHLTIQNNDKLIEEIQKSAEESKLSNLLFDFDIEFFRRDKMKLNGVDYISKYEEQNLRSAKSIIEPGKNGKIELPVNIYYGKLTFPFILYNTVKAKLYSSFENKKRIFKSTYNVVIVPINLINDSLTVDIFINYSKLNLDDGISRWTPIKKRITINNEWKMSSIVLPKENWSAFFSRNGKEYEIYGYSDYERFINEYINIKILNKERVK